MHRSLLPPTRTAQGRPPRSSLGSPHRYETPLKCASQRPLARGTGRPHKPRFIRVVHTWPASDDVDDDVGVIAIVSVDVIDDMGDDVIGVGGRC